MYQPDPVQTCKVEGFACRLSMKSRRLQGQKGQIVQAARRLYETQGVHRTTVKDIAQEVGITRELVYYYFSGKQQITDAVLDDYVEDLVESALVWNEGRVFGQTSESLRTCVQAFRRALYDASGQPRPMISVLEELGCRDEFDVRAVRETVNAINACVVTEYARFHKIEIDMVYEMFCVVLFGLVGLVKVYPGITDDELMKVIEQTLRLDMHPLASPPSAEKRNAAPLENAERRSESTM